MAKNVTFREIRTADGKIVPIPVDYKWEGEEGQALNAFLNWFNAPAFVEARKSMAIKDNLSEIMFHEIAPEFMAALLLNHLNANSEDMSKVDIAYYVIGNLVVPSGTTQHEIHAVVMRPLTYYLTHGYRLSSGMEVTAAFLEFLMRMALGDEVVDKILKAGGGGAAPLQGGGMVFPNGSIVTPGDLDPHGAVSRITGASQSSEAASTRGGTFQYNYNPAPSPYSYYVNQATGLQPYVTPTALQTGQLMMGGAMTFRAAQSVAALM